MSAGFVIPWPEVARAIGRHISIKYPDLAGRVCQYVPCEEGYYVEPLPEGEQPDMAPPQQEGAPR